MSYVLKTATSFKLDAAAAQAHLALPRVPGDRDLKAHRVNWLKSDWAQGKIRTLDWSTIEVDGVTYRVNGQHSATAALAFNPMLDLTVNMSVYVGKTMEDAVELWGVHDARDSSRTNSDRMKTAFEMYKGKIPALSTKTRNCLVNGISSAGNNWVAARSAAANALKILSANEDYIRIASTFAIKPLIAKTPVCAGLYLTYQADQTPAHSKWFEFWNYVVEENHPSSTHATRHLHRCLQRYTDKGGKFADSRGVVMYTIRAWNNFLIGSEKTLVVRENDPNPEVSIAK